MRHLPFKPFNRYTATCLAGTLLLMLSSHVVPSWAEPPMPDRHNSFSDEEEGESPSDYYSAYAEQAMEAYRKGESTKAIDLMTKAFRLAPDNSAVINNLAACYIQRGVYFQNTKKDFPKAISDYRLALFFLAHEWPSKAPRSGASEANIKILEDNLEGAMKNAGNPVNDWKWHLQSAWELRRKGNLQEAMVEYAWVTRLNPKHSEAWAAQGDIYTVRQKPDRAVVAYQKAVDTDLAPSSALYVKLGTALLQTGLPEKAVEAYNKALALSPGNKDALLALEQIWKKEITLDSRNMSAHLNLGAVYQQMGRYDDAFAQYQVADRLSPGNPLVKLNLGSLHQARGQLDQASAMYDTVLQQNPGNAQALLYKADILKQQGRAQEAEQFLQRALQASPDKKQVLDQLIAVYKAQGDPVKIKAGIRSYADAFPQDAAIQYQAGLSLHEAKEYEAAIEYYRKAIRLKPGMSEAHANMGTALHALNRREEAIGALQQAVTLNPSLDEVKNLISTLQQQKKSQTLLKAAQLHEQGNYKEALKGYEEAIKQDPENGDLYARYGLALQALKRFPDAIAAYDKAIRFRPEAAAYYYYKGTVYDEQNQMDTARTLYEKALSLDNDLNQAKEALKSLESSQATMLEAQALESYNSQNYAKALQAIDQLLKADPNHAMAYYYRGLVYDAQKKLEPARVAYQKSIDLNPALSDAVYALAVVLDTQGKKAEAKKIYQRFIDLVKDQPEDDFVKYAKERLSSL